MGRTQKRQKKKGAAAVAALLRRPASAIAKPKKAKATAGHLTADADPHPHHPGPPVDGPVKSQHSLVKVVCDAFHDKNWMAALQVWMLLCLGGRRGRGCRPVLGPYAPRPLPRPPQPFC